MFVLIQDESELSVPSYSGSAHLCALLCTMHWPARNGGNTFYSI